MTTPFSPSSPPRLHVEPLPAGATTAAVGRTTDDLGQPVVSISAWLPDRWATGTLPAQRQRSSDDAYEAFEQRHCHGCEYNCEEIDLDRSAIDHLEYIDDDGEAWTLTSATAESPCRYPHDNSLNDVSWPCYAGHDEPEPEDEDEEEDDEDAEPDSFVLGPMRFTTTRRLSNRSPYQLLGNNQGFTAALQAVRHDGEGELLGTAIRRVANTWLPKHFVCWGSNTQPRSLAEAAFTYAGAPCNSDLLPISAFIDNTIQARSDTSYPQRISEQLSFQLNPEATCALLVADAIGTPDAFLLLCASGAAVINGLAAIPAKWVSGLELPDGARFTGWCAKPLAGGACWLIGLSVDPPNHPYDPQLAVLIGQHRPTPTPTPALI